MALVDLPDSFPKALTIVGASLIVWAFTDVRTASVRVQAAAAVVDSTSAARSATLDAAVDSVRLILANPRLYSFQRDSVISAFTARIARDQRAVQGQRTEVDKMNTAAADLGRTLWFDTAVAAAAAFVLAYGGLRWRDQYNAQQTAARAASGAPGV